MAGCGWVIVALGLCPLLRAQLDTSVCRQTPSDHSGPSLPELPEQFSFRVEANLLSKNSTIDVRQWHDGTGNRGAARMWVSSVLLTYLFSYSTGQQFLVEAEGEGRYRCQASTLDTNKEPYLHGTANNNNNNNNNKGTTPTHIYTAAEALSFGGAIAEHYRGRSRVRGVWTDRWDSCVHWASVHATMTVQWYFTVGQEWDSAVGVGRVPVRCRVKGVVHSSPTPRPFLHLYEVTEFSPFLDGDPQVFETPAGTACEGRKVTKAVPAMPQTFSYSAEVVRVEARTVEFLKRAYDQGRKMVMVEQVSPLPPHPTLRLIDDFNTGARYTTAVTRGNCTLSPIPPSGVDVISQGASPRMRTPQEFFFDTAAATNLSYEGTRSVEGVETEVWVGVVSAPSSLPSAPQEVWEYYFTSPEWTEKGEGKGESNPVPVSIHITKNHQQEHEIRNVYNFRVADPEIWEYDVTSCYEDTGQFRLLQFFFPVTSEQLMAVSTNQKAFRRSLLETVTSLVPVSPARVNNIQLQFRSREVQAMLTLVEAPQVTSSVVTSGRQETSLAVAVSRLMDAVTQRHFLLSLPTAQGTLVLKASPTSTSVTATSTTTTTTTTTPSTPTPNPTPTPTHTPTRRSGGSGGSLVCSPQASRYTPGDVAAVAMGLLFGSYVLCLSLAVLWFRKCGLSPPAYHKDRMEMS